MRVGYRGALRSIEEGSVWTGHQPPGASTNSLLAEDMELSAIRYALPVDSVPAQTTMSFRALVQGNQRIVCRQSYAGDLVELFTAESVTRYPTNRVRSSLFACNWLEFDVLRFRGPEGDGHAEVALQWDIIVDEEGAPEADLQGAHRTGYVGGCIPVTHWRSDLLECVMLSFAPQSGSIRPGGAISAVRLRSHAKGPLRVAIVLRGLGDVDGGTGPSWDRGAGARLHAGRSMLGRSPAHVVITPSPVPAKETAEGESGMEWDLVLQPGQAEEIAVCIALANSETSCARETEMLRSRGVEDWLRQTIESAQCATQRLSIESGEWWSEFLGNHVMRGNSALRINAQGRIVGAAVAAEMVSETVNREDLFRGMQVHPLLAPEVFREFVTFTHAWLTPPDGVPFTENTAPNVQLPIVSEAYFRATGDVAFFLARPEIGQAIEELLKRLLGHRAPTRWLFPAEEVSDGHTLKEYDFCTNIQVWRAFRAASRMMDEMYGRHSLARQYEEMAKRVRQDVLETMTVDGVFGPQFAAATDLHSTICFMDGEDDLSALAPYLGFCEFSDVRWRNTCRRGFSEHNPIYDPRSGGLRWIDDPNIGHTIGTATAPSFASRLAAAVTRAEAAEEMRRIRSLADIDTTFYWYPVSQRVPGGLCHSLWMTGSASRVILGHYLGLDLDVPARRLTFRPWSPWHGFRWPQARLGTACFSLQHIRGAAAHTSVISNHNDEVWELALGFYVPAGSECEQLLIDGRPFAGRIARSEHHEETLITFETAVEPGGSLRATAQMGRSFRQPAEVTR